MFPQVDRLVQQPSRPHVGEMAETCCPLPPPRKPRTPVANHLQLEYSAGRTEAALGYGTNSGVTQGHLRGAAQTALRLPRDLRHVVLALAS